MRSIKKKAQDEPVALIDRFAVAFLSGVFAFITGCVLWLMLVAVFNRRGHSVLLIPFDFIWWFTGVMTFLGFLLVENFLADVIGKIWQFIYAFLANLR